MARGTMRVEDLFPGTWTGSGNRCGAGRGWRGTDIHLAYRLDVLYSLRLDQGILLRSRPHIVGYNVGEKKEYEGDHDQDAQHTNKVTEKYSVFVAHLKSPNFNWLFEAAPPLRRETWTKPARKYSCKRLFGKEKPCVAVKYLPGLPLAFTTDR
jgi:hypothetical protein